jgi:tellurite resistance protein TerC
MNALGLRQVWRVIIFVMGGTVMLIGIAMLVLPGPAFLVIPTGLAILGLEYRWARRWLRQAKAVLQRGVQSVSRTARPQSAADVTSSRSTTSATRRE